MIRATLNTSFTLIGCPGSGKSFYGRALAKQFEAPIYSASSILVSVLSPSTKKAMDAGHLLDDVDVSNAILAYLKENSPKGSYFFMDGFPRTLRQVHIMQSTWPREFQMRSAVHLDVPDSVCSQKIMGRRQCSVCNQQPNIANVQTDGFDLPPLMPPDCNNRCDSTGSDWKQRQDDLSMETVNNRLESYHKHSNPIIECYDGDGALFRFRPYKGEKDIPVMVSKLGEWINIRSN